MEHLNEGVFEKDNEMKLSLLAALAGQSILLLGPPGVAKSMVARRLKYAFKDAKTFEYLMSRFSTPDEIFGPVSIAKLKDSDKYERSTSGYLPDSDVVFLDEIWKAGPAIQNTLLTVINEKTFLNGDRQMKLPLKLLIGASNELPAQGEGLEALWDRFIIRIVSKPIQDDKNFLDMVMNPTNSDLESIDGNLQITPAEYTEWQKKIDEVKVPVEVQEAILQIRKALLAVPIEGTDLKRNIYVSDRRWKNIVRLLRTSAFMHGRKEVSPSDLLVATHCLWNESDEREPVAKMVCESLFLGYRAIISKMRIEVNEMIKKKNLCIALEKSRSGESSLDDELLIFDKFYYFVEGHNTGHSFIYIPDYRNMPITTDMRYPMLVHGIMYIDDQKRTIIRAYEEAERMKENGYNVTTCRLYRDNRHLYINGVRFLMYRAGDNDPIERTFAGISQDVYINDVNSNLEDKVDELGRSALAFGNSLKSHMFVSQAERNSIETKMASIKKEIAYLRNDISYAIYGS